MTDIDRELKEVQLQRERLALKRELARSKLTDTTSALVGQGLALGADAGAAAVSGVAFVASFTRRWWWVPVGAATLAAAGFVGLEWKEKYDREQLETARASYEADRSKFVDAQCPGNPNNWVCVSPDTGEKWNCIAARLRAQELDTCTPVAAAAFTRLRGDTPR
jgi:hypothetical protein